MSIDSTGMAKKIQKKNYERIGAKTTKRLGGNAKTNLALSGKFKIKMASSSSPV